MLWWLRSVGLWLFIRIVETIRRWMVFRNSLSFVSSWWHRTTLSIYTLISFIKSQPAPYIINLEWSTRRSVSMSLLPCQFNDVAHDRMTGAPMSHSNSWNSLSNDFWSGLYFMLLWENLQNTHSSLQPYPSSSPSPIHQSSLRGTELSNCRYHHIWTRTNATSPWLFHTFHSIPFLIQFHGHPSATSPFLQLSSYWLWLSYNRTTLSSITGLPLVSCDDITGGLNWTLWVVSVIHD